MLVYSVLRLQNTLLVFSTFCVNNGWNLTVESIKEEEKVYSNEVKTKEQIITINVEDSTLDRVTDLRNSWLCKLKLKTSIDKEHK